RRGMRLARLLARLETDDVFRLREREQISQFGGIEEVRGSEHEVAAAAQVAHRDGANAVGVDIGGDGPVLGQEKDAPAADMRSKHFEEDGKGDARLVAEARDTAITGVEVSGGASVRSQR